MSHRLPRSNWAWAVRVWLFVLAGCAAGCGNAVEPAANASASVESSPVLAVRLFGVKGAGDLLIGVYDNADDFENEGRPVATITVPPGVTEVSIHGLTAGRYGVLAFQDRNRDGVLNYQGGIPTEGYGSSGSVGVYDEPTFEAAAVDGGVANVRIHYLN